MSAQLDAWFTDPLGIPHVALGGYASQTLADAVARYIHRQHRPAKLIYAGDFDPSGVDLDRDFVRRVGVFDKVIRVALNKGQIKRYRLVENPDPDAKAKAEQDTRAVAFKRRYGNVVQYEVDALSPDVLRDLYLTALDDFWDDDAYDEVMAREAEERESL